MKKTVYIVLCVLGTILPYVFFVPFAIENGPNLGLFARQMFATPVASMLSADMLVSSLAFWAFIYFEIRKRPIQYWWLAIIANLAVGLSLGLPLFLLLREISDVPGKRKRHAG